MTTIPDKIGSLLFCPTCGSLLDIPKNDQDFIKCQPCGTIQNSSIYDNLTIITKSHKNAFQSSLLQKRQLVKPIEVNEESLNLNKQATIQENCPKCNNSEMQFYTMQLRSADEGSTVFYTCINCGYKFNQNN